MNKFKKHSLHEESSTDGTPAVAQLYRRSPRINALCSDNNSTLHDSGTESDDDELERLDSMSNASMGAHPGDVMGSSPPFLTSSPPHISDFDTNSWDSTGCESGIVIRDRSEEPNDTPEENILDLAIKGKRVLTSFGDAGKCDGVEAAGGRTTADSGTSETGAFRPVTRHRCSQQENQDTTTIFGANIAFSATSTTPAISQGTVGEKRRYDNITPKLRFGTDSDTQQSPIASRLRSFNNSYSSLDGPREMLTAARRQPVKLIIHNPSGVRRASQPLAAPTATHKGSMSSLQSESPPYHPLKRGRHNTSGRPSLDFEKMRERMMMNSACGIGSQEFVDTAIGDHDIEKRRHDWALNTSTSCGRRCPQHQQVRCQQTDCTFRPVELDNSLTGATISSLKDDA